MKAVMPDEKFYVVDPLGNPRFLVFTLEGARKLAKRVARKLGEARIVVQIEGGPHHPVETWDDRGTWVSENPTARVALSRTGKDHKSFLVELIDAEHMRGDRAPGMHLLIGKDRSVRVEAAEYARY